MFATQLAATAQVGGLEQRDFHVTERHDFARVPLGVQPAVVTAIPLVAADLLAVIVSFAIAWPLTTLSWSAAPIDWLALATGLTSALLVANLAVGLYPGIGLSAVAELRQASLACACIALIFLAVAFLRATSPAATQLTIATTCCLLFPSMSLFRRVTRAVFGRCAWWGQGALIVGEGAAAITVYSFLRHNPSIGLRPLGIVGERPAADHRAAPHCFLGPLSRAGAIARQFGRPWLIVATAADTHEGVKTVLGSLGRLGTHRTLVARLDGSPSLWNRAADCLDWPGDDGTSGITPPLRVVKRTIDVTFTIVAGPLLLPLMIVIATLIKLSSPGPALYQHERIGRNNRRFKAWKFRTMVCDADHVLSACLAACPQRREEWNRDHKLRDDPRVTAIGRWLRKTSLDELPQLLNVLWGEMSLVGPRPIVDAEVEKYGDRFGLYCNVSPGVTGLWQISGRNDTTYAERVELDSHYARHWSVWLDLYILVLTLKVVLFRQGAY